MKGSHIPAPGIVGLPARNAVQLWVDTQVAMEERSPFGWRCEVSGPLREEAGIAESCRLNAQGCRRPV